MERQAGDFKFHFVAISTRTSFILHDLNVVFKFHSVAISTITGDYLRLLEMSLNSILLLYLRKCHIHYILYFLTLNSILLLYLQGGSMSNVGSSYDFKFHSVAISTSSPVSRFFRRSIFKFHSVAISTILEPIQKALRNML